MVNICLNIQIIFTEKAMFQDSEVSYQFACYNGNTFRNVAKMIQIRLRLLMTAVSKLQVSTFIVCNKGMVILNMYK